MSKPTIVEAHAFNLKNSKGQTVGVLGCSEDDEPMIALCDARQRKRIQIGVTKDNECRIAMFDDEGFVRINLGFLPTGQGAIMVMGKAGESSAGLRGGYGEGVGFITVGGSGKVRHSIGIDGEGIPHLTILNPDGNVVFNAVRPTAEGRSTGGIVLPVLPRVPTIGGGK